jgi:hypothetical protein
LRLNSKFSLKKNLFTDLLLAFIRFRLNTLQFAAGINSKANRDEAL